MQKKTDIIEESDATCEPQTMQDDQPVVMHDTRNDPRWDLVIEKLRILDNYEPPIFKGDIT